MGWVGWALGFWFRYGMDGVKGDGSDGIGILDKVGIDGRYRMSITLRFWA